MRRPHYIALGIVVLFALILLNLSDRTTARLKLAIGGLFLPLFGLASTTHDAADRAGDAITSRSELLKQNEALRRENQQLRFDSTQAEEAQRENARLRKLLDRKEKIRRKLKLASVVLRDPANWWRTVQIDLGSRDGMTNDLPVLSGDFLIGRIASVSIDRSQVVLIGDPNCKVAATVRNDANDVGVLGIGGPFDGSLVELNYLSKAATLKPGQTVVTSGLGEVFPPGIPIGQVVDWRQVEYGLYTQARVKLGANLSALQEVWVLMP
jgi:rod shape-determining protein MreC